MNILKVYLKSSLFIEDKFDKSYLKSDVPKPKIASHQKWQNYLYEIGNKQGMRILEIGSRELTGLSNARREFHNATQCKTCRI